MHNKSHYLCGVRQDCPIHQGQEGEIHIQDDEVKLDLPRGN